MRYCKATLLLLLSFIILGLPLSADAQQPADSTKIVEILQATKKLEFRKIDDSTNLQIMVGNVRLRQGTTIFTCDSCVINNRLHVFEAFGKVHINDSDTANIYSDYLRYLTDKRLAYFQKNVRLTDGKGTLTTNALEYDVNTKLGTYTTGGKIVTQDKSVLTSDEGNYYTDLKEAYFKGNVVMKDPATELRTDSLIHNVETGVSRFIAETWIRDSSGRIIITRDGFYDSKKKKAELGRGAIIKDGPRTIKAQNIKMDDSSHISVATGNVVIIDTAQQTTLIAGVAIRNDSLETMLAFNKPLLIIKQDEDSIYVAADTLFSGRLSDLRSKPDSLQGDTVKGIKTIDIKKDTLSNKDSTNRYFEAYRNVRIFSDSVQAISDSAFYSFKDSVFRLFQDPVVWSRKSQITGDTILLFTKNKKADRFKVFENSFLVNQAAEHFFNQIKSARMDGFFHEGTIDSVKARGFAECVYYIQDEDSAFTGINQSTSDALDVYFTKDEIDRVVFRSAVKGTLWPMRSKSPDELKLQNFKWLEARRPKTKYEMYE